MVKFDDKSNPEYQKLENLIVKMITNSLTSQRLATSPDTEFPDPSARSTFSYPSQSSSSSPDRGNNATGQRNSTVNGPTYITYIQGFGGSDQSQLAFTSPGMPSRQKTVPIYQSRPSAAPNPHTISDSAVPNPGPPSIPRRRDTHAQTSRTNADDDPLNRLNMFDTVFITDDTGSMVLPVVKDTDGRSRWDVTQEALVYIADIAARHDDNGIDIKFLKATDSNQADITSGSVVQGIVESIDLWDGTHGGGTEFRLPLKEVIDEQLQKYREYLQQRDLYRKHKTAVSPKQPKFLNLIVITDGQADDEQEVEEYIVETARELDEMKAPTAYIGIQFLQIGDDPKATEFLEYLDDGLKNQTPRIRDVSLLLFFAFLSLRP